MPPDSIGTNQEIGVREEYKSKECRGKSVIEWSLTTAQR